MSRFGKKIVVSSGLLAGVALTALAANSLALSSANQSIAAGIAAIPGASVGKIGANLWGGQVVLENVALAGNGVAIRAERLVMPAGFRGFGLISPALALEGAVSVDNLVIVAGLISYKIKHLEATGTSLTAADFAAMVDPNSPKPVADRLANFTATGIAAPEVVGTVQLGDISETLTYSDVKLANIVAGKIGDTLATVLSAQAPIKNVWTNACTYPRSSRPKTKSTLTG